MGSLYAVIQYQTQKKNPNKKRINDLLDICCYSGLLGSTVKMELGR